MTYQEEVDEREPSMDGWREGSPQTFRRIFMGLYPTFLSFSGALLNDGQDARQVTTEAFLMLWKKRTDFDELRNIKAFLYNTIRGNALNYLRFIQKDPSIKEYIPVFYPDESLPEELIRELRAYAASGT